VIAYPESRATHRAQFERLERERCNAQQFFVKYGHRIVYFIRDVTFLYHGIPRSLGIRGKIESGTGQALTLVRKVLVSPLMADVQIQVKYVGNIPCPQICVRLAISVITVSAVILCESYGPGQCKQSRYANRHQPIWFHQISSTLEYCSLESSLFAVSYR
jgi:hypothetical protein